VPRAWLEFAPAGLSLVGSAVAARPLRAGLFAGVGVLLALPVLLGSLPYALMPGMPGLARFLSPGNPAMLLAEADELRLEMLALAAAVQSEGSGAAPRQGRPPVAEQRARMEEIRSRIRTLATAIIAAEPLNARGFRLLAEVTENTDEVRALMLAALQRSRRESAALFWLLNDNFVRKDYVAVADNADILLRTRPQLAQFVHAYLAEAAGTPEGLAAVIDKLATAPPWRYALFRNLPELARESRIPLDVLSGLQRTAAPPTNAEIEPYLNRLIALRRIDESYNAWLRLLPRDELATVGFLTNPGFEREPSGLPFDWTLARGQNALAELVAGLAPEGRRLLHIGFSAGRIRFPEVRQLLILPAGRFRIEGQMRGGLTGRRGIRWQARCALNPQRVLGETEPILGQMQQWRGFQFEFVTPESDDCRAVELRLYHDARSISEEYMSGEVFFDDIQLERRPL
jgi:hypothetical protein